ncbi:glycosyltransferase family 4 protein [Cellulomonas shaoxiangyii]|uniref:glycosyltransferase family 4 protein n=1 Tax=Cellulomonas shaoxiangyii TaxID=2566013 RepID=UPI0014087600|nr:glycosyltransferase family 4 protein [Cellulomonas shaoxiangyii]
MRVVFVTPALGDNSLGRTYALWLLARHLGWETSVVALHDAQLWGPLAQTAFAADCRAVGTSPHDVAAALAGADLCVAIKPFANSLGAAHAAARAAGVPLLADVDDPDIEKTLAFGNTATAWTKRVARELMRRPKVAEMRRMRRLLQDVPVLTSNPTLQQRYGGTVIPHARPDLGQGAPHVHRRPTVAFVGTNRAHKGVPELRAAVARLQDDGYRLVITDDAPSDAHTWETWMGTTTLDVGLSVTRDSDVVAIPSHAGIVSRGQLPAKLIDAMMLGRAIVASDLPPVRWALGEAGILVRPGSVAELTAALARLADPGLRTSLGARARKRALSHFTVEQLAPEFAAASNRLV